MSAPETSPPATDARARYDTALGEFGAAFAAARRRRDEAYAAGGAQAVAEAAHVPGGPSIEELTEGYERLAEQARRQQHSGTAA